MNQELIVEKIECLTNRVNIHGTEIDGLKIENVKLSSSVDNMNSQLEKLNDNLKWLVRMVASAVIAGVISAVAALII